MRSGLRRVVGFTLIELMVTVAVVAILAAVALPSYADQIRKTRRAVARQEMMDLATAQERFYTNCNRFANTLAGSQADCSGLGRPTATVMTDGNHYQISMAGGGANYVLTATPQGEQAHDTYCANLTLDDAGNKGATGSLGPAACW